MTNIIAFQPRPSRPVPLPNPSYAPADVVEMTPRERKRLARRQAEPATETARNARARRALRTAWCARMTRVNYYRAALDMEHAIDAAHRWKAPEAQNHPGISATTRVDLLERYRAAIADQIRQPAPTQNEVEWKRRQIKSGQFAYFPMSEQEAMQAIERDIAFLRSHPVRKPKCA